MSEFKAGGLIWNSEARNHLRETSWEGWRENCQAIEDHEEFLPENVRNSMLPDHDVQGRMNACTGFGGTTAVESALLRYDGTKVKLSEMFTYTRAQHWCGLLGDDTGATIDAVRKTITQDGCLVQTGNAKEDYRFSGKYYLPEPHEWATLKAKARELIVPTTSRMGSYDDVLNFLRSYGTVVIGSKFYTFMAQSGVNVFPDWGTADNIGMHCYCFVGWSKRRDNSGRRFIYAANSWPNWGRNGVAEFSPKLIDNLFKDRFTDAFGVTFRGPKDPAPVGLLSYRTSRRR